MRPYTAKFYFEGGLDTAQNGGSVEISLYVTGNSLAEILQLATDQLNQKFNPDTYHRDVGEFIITLGIDGVDGDDVQELKDANSKNLDCEWNEDVDGWIVLDPDYPEAQEIIAARAAEDRKAQERAQALQVAKADDAVMRDLTRQAQAAGMPLSQYLSAMASGTVTNPYRPPAKKKFFGADGNDADYYRGPEPAEMPSMDYPNQESGNEEPAETDGLEY